MFIARKNLLLPEMPVYSKRGRIIMRLINSIKVVLARFDGTFDPLYPRALALVLEVRDYSVAFLQRQYRIGYGRAVRLRMAIVIAILCMEEGRQK